MTTLLVIGAAFAAFVIGYALGVNDGTNLERRERTLVEDRECMKAAARRHS